MTRKRNGKAKEIDQETRLKETIWQNDNMPERQTRAHLEKKIVLYASTTKQEIVVTIESAAICGHPPALQILQER